MSDRERKRVPDHRSSVTYFTFVIFIWEQLCDCEPQKEAKNDRYHSPVWNLRVVNVI